MREEQLHHFTAAEFRCSCGECGLGFKSMQGSLLQRLDRARAIAAVPFVLTSAIRCETHNAAVGGVDSSAHLTGHAVDIAVSSGRVRYRIIDAALAAGFDRIGVGETFVHVDCDPAKPAHVIWTY